MRAPAFAVAAALVLVGAAHGGAPLRGQIVYTAYTATDQVQVFRERADGTGRVRLTYGKSSYDQPRWSPDGRRIVVSGAPGLVVLAPNGRAVRRIAVRSGADVPRWSPDGKEIAYLVLSCADPAGHEDPSCADLWVVRADGSGRRRLTTGGAVDATASSYDSLYSWAPDGRRIVYAGRKGVTIVQVATGRERLLRPPTNLLEQSPQWSPDGKWILFEMQRAPFRTSDLALIAPDGSGYHKLLHTGDTLEPRWSPDGKRIATLVQPGPGSTAWSVVVLRPDGTGRHRVGTSGDYQVLEWSPDSTHVLFVGDTRLTMFEIAPAEGHAVHRFITGGESPDWAP